MGFKIECVKKKFKNKIFLSPKVDSLVEILKNIVNKHDEKKLLRSKYVHENYSWENVVKKLKKEFENKLGK